MTASIEKVIALLGLLALLLIPIGTFTGCRLEKGENGGWVLVDVRTGDKEWALAELEKRYDEKFEYFRSANSPEPSSSSYFLVSCDSYDDLVFVEVHHEGAFGEGERELSDNFVAVKYANEVCKWAQPFFDEVFEKSVVMYESVNHYPLFTDYSADTTFAEYISNEKIRLDLVVSIPESAYTGSEQFEASADRLLNAFTGTGLTVDFVVLPDDMAGSVDKSEILSLSSSESCIASASLNVFITREPVLSIQEGDRKWSIEL